ncbi:hypothetical protein LEP1GSC047_4060 [Leptospira inadai serovar Lyme str. 10]|uniref:Uncharacterized protein n=2 Tax=Leptospira inadai serovar Lyme TaxID=293084 RepID=V6HDQ5_9LEPT|nr:hypothetical protein [Leptospira inadai]EQA37278.1 hypothetical protein LEP1GSC047_4060 [Leptospira inadai serovar Lyme str. 10]PNV73368.1 hypothetical protein BES34_017280 [Leptospira inadai serovar Lyme]
MNFLRLKTGALLLVCIGSAGLLLADEQDQRLDPAGIYKLPHEVIPPDDIAKLKETLANPPEGADPIALIRAPLDRYYAQFVDPKRTEEERRLGKIFTEKTDRNTLRLLILKMVNKLADGFVLRESPILFELHSLLAHEYAKKKQNFKALEEASTALRYRDFAHTEESFSKESRLRELYDTAEIEKARGHGRIAKELSQAGIDWNKAKDKVHVLEAANVRGKELLFEENRPKRKIDPKDMADARQNVKLAEERLKQADASYKDSFEKNYYPFFKRKSREDASAVFDLAKYVKEAENENKERLKVVNKTSVSGQGIFVLFDYKRNTDYFGYAGLLEIAFRLDPEYSPVVLNLAQELRSAGKKSKALDFYLKYLTLALKENKTDAEMAQTYREIASLHTELKQYVLAAEYYEKYYQAEPDPKRKGLYAFELGNFFETKIGNLEKGAFYYSDWLEGRAKETETESELSFPDSQERFRMETLAHLGISRLYRYQKKPVKEKAELLKAIDSYTKLRENLAKEDRKYSEGKKELLAIKKGLLERTNDQDMAQYRLKSLELEETKERMDVVRTKLDTSPGTKAMQRVSILFEFDKDFAGAKKFNEEILKTGTQTEMNLALRNIERINRILEDGIPRDAYPRDPLASDTP